MAVVDGKDENNERGNFVVLRLESPICAEWKGNPQNEVELVDRGRKSGDHEASPLAKWAGKNVHVIGDARSLEIYAEPFRPIRVIVDEITAR